MIQLLLGLEVLHRNQVLHRDLKPENVFIDKDDNVKIGVCDVVC
jgi:translation initiation factor 2-alpha kinase 4